MRAIKTAVSTNALSWKVLLLGVALLLGLVWLLAVRTPSPALSHMGQTDHTWYLDCPTTDVREGEDVDVFLVLVSDHVHSVTFGAYWHTDAGTAGTSDYHHQNSGAVWANDEERRANRAKRTFRTKQDNLIEGNETFTARFSGSGNVTDPNDPDRDDRCEITIIDDDPNITDISIISEPVRDNNKYGAGEVIEIEAKFSTSVDVSDGGNPGLGLWVGDNWRSARYLRGSGSNKLVFGYTVKPSDSDDDGIKMDGGYKDSEGLWHNFLNHTAVTATGTETVAYRAYAGIDDQSQHKVDGSLAPVGTSTTISSSPASGDTYRYGESIEFSITFSAALDVEGSRHVNLRVGTGDSASWRRATYKSGSGSNTLVFGYTVQTSDSDTDGVRMNGTWIDDGEVKGLGGTGTLKIKGTETEVTPTVRWLSDQSDHKINGQPYPKTISITSTPVSATDTYGRDEVIQVSVDFGQNVTAADSSFAILRIGSIWTQRNAVYTSGNGTDTLLFEYTVVEGDRDDNGVDAFVPHGRDIKATGTNVAYQPNPGGVTPTMGEDSSHKVNGHLVTADTTSPTITRLSFRDNPGPGDDDTYAAGDYIGVSVAFSESVLVTGTPQLELNMGGTVRQANYGILAGRRTIGDRVRSIPNGTVFFGYYVQEGDSDSDGISIDANKITLNGGTIQDEAGNNAVLTHSAVAADSGHKVDAPDVTGPTVSSVAITSDPGEDNTYGAGDNIEVTVTFSEDATITGTPQLEIDVGGTAKTASYSNVTGAAAVFSYTVASGDSDADGVAIGENKLSLNGGTIKDAADNDATLSHSAVAADSGHLVDGVGPTVSSVAITSDPGDDDTYGIGNSIQVTVTFNENVTVTGAPQLEIDVGGTAKMADYSSVSGAAVVFIYTVVVGDSDSDGISIGANKLSLNSGTIKDSHGNDATLTHTAVAADDGHKVEAPGGI